MDKIKEMLSISGSKLYFSSKVIIDECPVNYVELTDNGELLFFTYGPSPQAWRTFSDDEKKILTEEIYKRLTEITENEIKYQELRLSELEKIYNS